MTCFGELWGCRLVVSGLVVFRCVELWLVVVSCRVSCWVVLVVLFTGFGSVLFDA